MFPFSLVCSFFYVWKCKSSFTGWKTELQHIDVELQRSGCCSGARRCRRGRLLQSVSHHRPLYCCIHSAGKINKQQSSEVRGVIFAIQGPRSINPAHFQHRQHVTWLAVGAFLRLVCSLIISMKDEPLRSKISGYLIVMKKPMLQVCVHKHSAMTSKGRSGGLRGYRCTDHEL